MGLGDGGETAHRPVTVAFKARNSKMKDDAKYNSPLNEQVILVRH